MTVDSSCGRRPRSPRDSGQTSHPATRRSDTWTRDTLSSTPGPLQVSEPRGLGGAQHRQHYPRGQTTPLPPVQQNTPCRRHNTVSPLTRRPSGRPDAWSTLRPVPRGRSCKLSCLRAPPHTHVHAGPAVSRAHTGGRGTQRLLEKGHRGGGAEPTWEKRRHEKCPSSQLSPFPGSFSARSLLPLRSFGSSTTQTTVVGAEAAWADEPRCGPGLSLPLAVGTHPCRGGVGLLGFGVFLCTHAVRQQGDPGRDEASHRHQPWPAPQWPS